MRRFFVCVLILMLPMAANAWWWNIPLTEPEPEVPEVIEEPEVVPECPECEVCRDDVVLSWTEDIILEERSNYNKYKGYCIELKLDGKTNWRLPTIEELMTLDLTGEYVSQTYATKYIILTYNFDTGEIGRTMSQIPNLKYSFRCVSQEGQL